MNQRRTSWHFPLFHPPDIPPNSVQCLSDDLNEGRFSGLYPIVFSDEKVNQTLAIKLASQSPWVLFPVFYEGASWCPCLLYIVFVILVVDAELVVHF